MSDKPNRPNWAQVVQAIATCLTLALAGFGYFYTVQPIATKQRAEEDRDAAILTLRKAESEFETAKRDRDAATIELQTAQSEFSKVKSDRDRALSELRRVRSEFGSAQADLREAKSRLDETNTSLRRYVIDFYVRALRTEFVALGGPFSVEMHYFMRSFGPLAGSAPKSGESTEALRSKWTFDRDVAVMQPIFDKLGFRRAKSVRSQEYESALSARTATGRDLIRAFLAFDELRLLSAVDQQVFVSTVRAISDNDADVRITQPIQARLLELEFQRQAPNTRDIPPLTERSREIFELETSKLVEIMRMLGEAINQLDRDLRIALSVPAN